MSQGQGYVRQVTLETLGTFAPLLKQRIMRDATDYPDDEEEDQANVEPDPPSPEYQQAEQLFAGTSIVVQIPFRFGRPTHRQPQVRPTRPPPPPIVAVPAASRGVVRWKKTLKASDVQSQRGHGTGGIRLTQAKFRWRGQLINQTTYFRNDLFGGQIWRVGRAAAPVREDAVIAFDVTILGKHLGVQQIKVSHKPSGEAGQSNYTSILHWGDLSDHAGGALIGRILSIYNPPAGANGPFVLEII